MNNHTIVSSLTSEKGMTQAGLVYVCTALDRRQHTFRLIDLSGRISYFHPPERLRSTCSSRCWMNPDSIRRGDWMDCYLPSTDEAGDVVFFSSAFSPDVVFHARYSHNIRTANPKVITAIGGAALATMGEEQLKLLTEFFDYVLVGHDVTTLIAHVLDNGRRPQTQREVVRAVASPDFSPDYSRIPLDDFVTVYTGHGCYYGNCRFCDYPARAYQNIVFRCPTDVARDIHRIAQLRPSVHDIVLTQDSYTQKYLVDTAHETGRYGGQIPYNLMLRAEPWLSHDIGDLLARSGCTDVFIGAEALDDELLQVLNKGVSVRDILNAVKVLSEYVDVTIGMILFVPGATKAALCSQLRNLEQLLPYLYSIEPEVLTVVNGSTFAREPSRYGIVLNATKNVLNDSWCFGLSQDIPWTLADTDLIETWLAHTDELRKLCAEYVRMQYWDAIEYIRRSYLDTQFTEQRF